MGMPLTYASARRESTHTYSAHGSHPASGEPLVLSGCATCLGQLQAPLNSNREGLALANVLVDRSGVDILYFGPDDLWLP